MKYDVVILIDAGIGNAVEALYALEYLMQQNVKVGCYMGSVNPSFQAYLKTCYSKHILDNISDVETKVLIHGFTYQKEEMPKYEQYIYVSADFHSTHFRSETEQFLDIVQSLYPSSYQSYTLEYLKEEYSDKVKDIEIEEKTVLYSGCSAINPIRRWPYFKELMLKLGKSNVVFVGGKEDIDFSYSYFYPKWITRSCHQKILNQKKFWTICKKLGILKPHAHWKEFHTMNNVFINKFNWGELVSIFKRSNNFVGNDGGLMHLAAAAGAEGVVIFGPTSSKKNKPYNKNIKVLNNQCCCSQFGEEGKIYSVKSYVNCPCQLKCMYDCKVEDVLKYI